MFECDRDDEFSPVKNATGADSVKTCRAALTEQYGRWLEAAGARVPRKADGTVDGVIEISPMVATGPEHLAGGLASRFTMNPGERVKLEP